IYKRKGCSFGQWRQQQGSVWVGFRSAAMGRGVFVWTVAAATRVRLGWISVGSHGEGGVRLVSSRLRGRLVGAAEESHNIGSVCLGLPRQQPPRGVCLALPRQQQRRGVCLGCRGIVGRCLFGLPRQRRGCLLGLPRQRREVFVWVLPRQAASKGGCLFGLPRQRREMFVWAAESSSSIIGCLVGAAEPGS
nr:hypothetical protein [Tanacetum cinerariifolium]